MNSQNKVIISDTTCLIAFTNAEKIDILKNTFDNIEVTPYVKNEYEEKNNNILPDWITVKEPCDKKKVNELRLKNKLHAGESEAIVLAMEENNALLILDDLYARNYALGMGLKVTGTLGVINEARIKELINIDEAVDISKKMKENGLWVTEKFFDDFVKYMKEDNEKRTIKN